MVLPYVQHVADALGYAHEQHLVHRDVKPENLLLGKQQQVLLADFGVAIVAHSSRSATGQHIAGTVAYMAPEQLQGKPRPASDQYALAVVVYEWLTGTRPFQGSYAEVAMQHVLTPPPPLRTHKATISPATEEAVLTALAKDPQERFATVRAFANALVQASQDEGSSPTPVRRSLQVLLPATGITAPVSQLEPGANPAPDPRDGAAPGPDSQYGSSPSPSLLAVLPPPPLVSSEAVEVPVPTAPP